MSDREQALQNLKNELDRGPITENEVEISSRLGLPPRGLSAQDRYVLSQPYTGQSVEPDYGPQGLQQVSPAAEFFGLGIGKIAANAIGKTKMYSDQVVDRFTRMTTPNTRYHGGPSGIGTLRTPYDRSMQGQTIKEGQQIEMESGKYVPFQAATFTGTERTARMYSGTGLKGKSLYEVDTSTAKKVFNFAKPSGYMKKELDKAIKAADDAGDVRKKLQLEHLDHNNFPKDRKHMTHVFPAQREFLEKYGYDSIKSEDTTLFLRPEKLKTKELTPEVLLAEKQGKAFRKDLAKKTGAAIGATALVGGILGSQYGKGFN